jgi:hypothetical protein
MNLISIDFLSSNRIQTFNRQLHVQWHDCLLLEIIRSLNGVISHIGHNRHHNFTQILLRSKRRRINTTSNGKTTDAVVRHQSFLQSLVRLTSLSTTTTTTTMSFHNSLRGPSLGLDRLCLLQLFFLLRKFRLFRSSHQTIIIIEKNLKHLLVLSKYISF